MPLLPLYLHKGDLSHEIAVSFLAEQPKIPINEQHCEDLAHVNYANFVISLVILIGLVLSYIPQHYRIISRRSSEGISPYFVLLGTTSATSALANIFALPGSREDIACCYVNKPFSCFAAMLGIGQITMQWICFFIILLLFIIYFPKATAFVPPEDIKTKPTYKTALTVTFAAILHAVALAITTIAIGARAPQYLQAYANALGICAACLTSIQYFPQLYTTWKLGRIGAISIPMMCIQTPGGFLWAASLSARLGWAGWSAWGIYLITATMQGVLLVMGIIFELQHRKRKRQGLLSESETTSVSGDTVSEENNGNSETSPLLKATNDNK